MSNDEKINSLLNHAESLNEQTNKTLIEIKGLSDDLKEYISNFQHNSVVKVSTLIRDNVIEGLYTAEERLINAANNLEKAEKDYTDAISKHPIPQYIFFIIICIVCCGLFIFYDNHLKNKLDELEYKIIESEKTLSSMNTLGIDIQVYQGKAFGVILPKNVKFIREHYDEDLDRIILINE